MTGCITKQGYRPKLQPYKPLAKCNRNAVVFANQPIPAVRFCAPRNTHEEFARKRYEQQVFLCTCRPICMTLRLYVMSLSSPCWTFPVKIPFPTTSSNGDHSSHPFLTYVYVCVQYKTHNGCFYPKWDNLPVGFENMGIMSDFASRTHLSQTR